MEELHSPQIIVQAERRVQELRGLSLNLEQSETRGLQAESPADDLCSLSLNLEPAEPIVVHVPRMNGARNSDSRDSSDCGSPSSTEPLLPRHLELPEILTDQAPTFTAGDTDRRNDFYCLKRFVFLSFGVPDAPALSSRRVQKCITCFAVLFYFILFIWGTLLISIEIMEDGYIWKRRCAEVLPAKTYTILAGFLYLMLGVYWMALLWWSKCTKPVKDTHFRSFSGMAFFWWLLCMYYCVVTTALAMEVYAHRDIIFSTGNSEGQPFVECAQKGTRAQWGPQDDGEFLYVPTNMVPLWALCSLVGVFVVNLCVFVINAIMLYKISRQQY